MATMAPEDGGKGPVSEDINEQLQSRALEDDLEPGHFDVANIERIYR